MPRVTSGFARRRLSSACLHGLLIAGALHAGGALAADPAQPLDQLDHTVFTPREGAPSGVNALEQTSDGFLWIGTSAGLFRFDGARFTRFASSDGTPLPDLDITMLRAAPSGGLWAGTRFGRIYRIEGGRVRAFGPSDGLQPHTILGLAVGADGVVWAASGQGVLRLDGQRWVAVPGPRGAPVPAGGIDALMADAAGRMWASGEDTIFCLEQGAAAFVEKRSTRLLAGMVRDEKGRVWASDADGTFALDDPTQGVATPDLERLFRRKRPAVGIDFFDREGSAWGESDGHYFRFPAAWIRDAAARVGEPPPLQLLPPGQRQSASRSSTIAFIEDREGNVWVGTNGGLDRFRSNKFRHVETDGRTLANGGIAAARDGRLWIAAGQDLGSIGLGDAFVSSAARAALAHLSFLDVYGARDGSVYVGGVSALKRVVDGGVEDVALPKSDRMFALQSVAEDGRGDLWISMAPGGVFRRRGGEWTRNGGVPGLDGGAALALKGDDAGRVWIGYPRGEIALVDGDHVRRLGAAEGLAIGNVLAFLPEPRGTWVGGMGGLALFDGARFHAVLDAQGLPFSGVSGVLRTPEGQLWINGAAGVTLIEADEVDRFVKDPGRRVATETFGVEAGVEGLPQTLRPLPTAVATPDGRLWFETTNGLYWIDPRRIARNAVPPHVEILAIAHDGQQLATGAAATLPARTRAFRIDYTATSLGVPDLVRFRYRLDGVDTDWQDAGSRRQAFYTNLPPGLYDFHVMAANEDGLWSTSDATVTITIPAVFWQTRWFQLLCVAALVAAGFVVHALRTRVLTRQARVRFQDVLRERARIARDLHDTLLQGTQGLVLNFQVVAGEMARDDARRCRMEALLDEADHVIAQARDRVHDLRDLDGEHADLVASLSAVGTDLAAGTTTSFEVRVDPSLPPLCLEIRGELFLAGREALLNAFRHAHARSIALEFSRFRRGLLIAVRDDGRGIDERTLADGGRHGHWGLAGMRERAERIGGTFVLRSREGQGTETRIEVPARLAFELEPTLLASLWQRLSTAWRRPPLRDQAAT